MLLCSDAVRSERVCGDSFICETNTAPLYRNVQTRPVQTAHVRNGTKAGPLSLQRHHSARRASPSYLGLFLRHVGSVLWDSEHFVLGFNRLPAAFSPADERARQNRCYE